MGLTLCLWLSFKKYVVWLHVQFKSLSFRVLRTIDIKDTQLSASD